MEWFKEFDLAEQVTTKKLYYGKILRRGKKVTVFKK